MGRVECFEMHIPQLDRMRIIRVYLPEAYEIMTQQHFPVIYMHDGQNLYDKSTGFGGSCWEVKETMKKLEEEGKTKGIIIVGIDNDSAHRCDEYSPWNTEGVGEGMLYASFVATTLKKYIDEKYRTLPDKEHTAIAGSSMGGIISLIIAFKYGDVFSKIGIFSIASWFAEGPILDFIRNKSLPEKQKYFVTVGTSETSDDTIDLFPQIYLECSKRLCEALCQKKVPDSDLFYEVYEGEMHSAKYWAKHFPTFVEWAFELK